MDLQVCVFVSVCVCVCVRPHVLTLDMEEEIRADEREEDHRDGQGTVGHHLPHSGMQERAAMGTMGLPFSDSAHFTLTHCYQGVDICVVSSWGGMIYPGCLFQIKMDHNSILLSQQTITKAQRWRCKAWSKVAWVSE